MSDEQFTCNKCGGTFDQGWTEEEATAELTRDFPGLDKSDCGVLCDDCYKDFNAWRATAVEFAPPSGPPHGVSWFDAIRREMEQRIIAGNRTLYRRHVGGDDTGTGTPRGILP